MREECKIEVRVLLEEADQGNLRLLMSWINVGEVY